MAVEKETWKNVTRGMRHVKAYDARGDWSTVIVQPGKLLTITPEERRINMAAAANDKQNLFLNGSLVPVKLLTPEDEAEFASNPNNLGDKELKDLFSLPIAKFREKVAQIDNVYALDRLAELADDDNTKATVKHVQALTAQREAVGPAKPKRITPVDQRKVEKLSGAGPE